VPNPKNFANLLESLKDRNISLDIETSKALSDSLDEIKSDDSYFNTLVRILVTRCMSQAVYFSSGSVTPSQFYHYGLAVPIYTHFTSPIRRYADDIVHRLLGCAIGVYPLSEGLNNQVMRKISSDINFRHKMAQYAARSSVSLHTVIFFKDKTVTQEGYITRLKANGFNVLVPKYGIEETVILKKEEQNINFDAKQQILTLANYKLRVFDKVTVEISVDNSRQQLQIKCLSPPIHTSSQSTTNSPLKHQLENTSNLSKNSPQKKAKIKE